MTIKFLAVAAAVLAVGLCMAEPAAAQGLQCAGSGATYDVTFSGSGQDAALVTVHSREPLLARPPFALMPQRTGSGFSYANEFAQLRGKGSEAELEIDGQRVRCVASDAGRLPGPEDAVANIGTGQSLGGKVRSGPGLDHRQVDSLPEGAPLGIIRNSGVSYNGYDWFEVQIGDTRGYQWGGILCSDNRHIAGVFQQCGGGAGGSSSAVPTAGGPYQSADGLCTVFEHVDFQGWGFTLEPGMMYARFSKPGHNDHASSAIVPRGCRLQLFEHWDFQGYVDEYGAGGHSRLRVNDQYSSAMCLCP